MKITTTGKWLLLAAVALFCFAPCAIAQTYLTLEAANSGSYDGYNIGPYTMQVGSSPGTGPAYGMICDDFTHDIAIGDYWQATPISVNAGNLGSTLFGAQGATLMQYEEAAELSYAILFNTQGASNNALMQFAIWYIFDPSGVAGKVSGTDLATIQAWVAWAGSQSNLASLLSEFVVWTPVPGTCGPGSCYGQEFFQFVPEGGAALMYLLLAGVSCFGAMFFRSRRMA